MGYETACLRPARAYLLIELTNEAASDVHMSNQLRSSLDDERKTVSSLQDQLKEALGQLQDTHDKLKDMEEMAGNSKVDADTVG